MGGLNSIQQALTEKLAQEICEKVFSSFASETLKITLADRTEIPLGKQFFTYYKNQILKYSKEEMIIKMANIFEHSLQDIHKYRIYKEKLESLNRPEDFFDTKISDTVSAIGYSGINSENVIGSVSNKELKLHRYDKENVQVNQVINRSGQSALNEDFNTVEKDGSKKDKSLESFNKSKSLLDINVSGADINLDSVSASASTVERQEISPQTQEEESGPDVFYTNISLNKSTNNLSNNSSATNKSFVSAKNLNNLTKNTLATNRANKDYKTIKLSFSYSEKTLRVLNTFVSNFRESFLSSFSPLFVPCWSGY